MIKPHHKNKSANHESTNSSNLTSQQNDGLSVNRQTLAFPTPTSSKSQTTSQSLNLPNFSSKDNVQVQAMIDNKQVHSGQPVRKSNSNPEINLTLDQTEKTPVKQEHSRENTL